MPLVRIGELSRRVGVGVSTLRAWERRFGLLAPTRSASGQRLYADPDVMRVQAVQRLLGDGLTLSAAVGRVLAAPGEPELREHHDALFLDQIMQAVDRGIWVCQGGRTRYVNRCMAELMRCGIDELMASSMLDVVDAKDTEWVRARYERVREGRPQQYETRLRRSDGSSFRADVLASPILDAVGGYQGAVSVISLVAEGDESTNESLT
ncbi:MAG: MerR family transcriptional regulator, light-induced transcriptional regulator [Actinomycetota bacterium]|nr:MerR family transcriptional regulator, light-induced transcriptional regulator [Actinomycetota bacterium]